MRADRSIRRWTDAELSALHRLQAQRTPLSQIAAALGMTTDRVRQRQDWERRSPESRAKRAAAARKYREREPVDPTRRVHIEFSQTTSRPNAALVADRSYRQRLAPRDLTALVFGDPLPGYSALDRRAGGR